MIAYTAVGLLHPSLGETLEIITASKRISTQGCEEAIHSPTSGMGRSAEGGASIERGAPPCIN
jgi:hypothetical protein